MSRPIPKLAGVCGWPIHHSLSPVLHSYWLRKMKVAGAYVPFLVRADEAERAFRSLPKTTISGVNVTLPLKRMAYEAADARTDDAEQLGVANCLYVRRGRLVAHNTDREGFALPLLDKRTAQSLAHMTATVYGAGGAARAVLGALTALGVPEIRLLSRRDEQARDMADMLSLPSLYPVPWAEREEAARGAGLIINATAGGMRGKPPLDVHLRAASPGALAYDLIYTPEHTPFLAAAEARELDTIGGLAMLIAQARPSFRLFFGVSPADQFDPTAQLRAALK